MLRLCCRQATARTAGPKCLPSPGVLVFINRLVVPCGKPAATSTSATIPPSGGSNRRRQGVSSGAEAASEATTGPSRRASSRSLVMAASYASGGGGGGGDNLSPPAAAQEVYAFWFDGNPGKSNAKLWYSGGKEADDFIKSKFSGLVEDALSGRLSGAQWEDTPVGACAKTIVLDQFTRQINRGTPEAFAGDAQAQVKKITCMQFGPIDPDELARGL